MNMKRFAILGVMTCVLVISASPERVFAQEQTQESKELRLTLEHAVRIALKNNYDLLLAIERVEEVEGTETTALGGLLPHISGSANGRHIKTFQGEFGGRPTTSTPRDIHDVRTQLTQSIFSLSLLRRWQAGRTRVDATKLDAEVARQDTIATAALLYMDAVRAQETVNARESNVELSQRLWTMTLGRKAAGAATGIDTTRAEGQWQREKQRLLEAMTGRNRAKLDLVRAMGISYDTNINLSDPLAHTPTMVPAYEHLVKEALAHRKELTAQQRKNLVAEFTFRSIRGERMPSLDFRGNYGLIGESFNDRLGSYDAGIFLSIPLFDGGEREGRIQESRSQVRQELIRTKNLVHQISIEVRDAVQRFQTAQEQVGVSQEGLRLARKELRLVEKAFSIGTVSHIEVLNAQQSLFETEDLAINVLFEFNAARINLARAEGKIDTIFGPYQKTGE